MFFCFARKYRQNKTFWKSAYGNWSVAQPEPIISQEPEIVQDIVLEK